MYKSTLKQESTKPLDLNYSKYLDFANAVTIGYDQTYTTTQKGMVFGKGYSHNWQEEFIINNITIVGKDNTGSHVRADVLPVSSGVSITKYGANGQNYGTIMFVPFTDQTIAVPNFSKMTELTGTSYSVTNNGCLFSAGKSSGDVTITYNNIIIPPSERTLQYLIKGMIITSTKNFSGKYFIPIEE